ncbi:hypothetical protein BCPG_01687 [Burkholderia cenocepacia PC184]|nr:hypothetical protein BCPG_01687 [Burkholderia cenocepacia PC184]
MRAVSGRYPAGMEPPTQALKRPLRSTLETRMTTYFTIGDFILLIPMALAGALFLGAVPCATQFRHNLLRVLGVILGVGVAVLLVEGLPALI